MKQAVVTGADGFIGTHLVRRLSAAGVHIYAICRPDSTNTARIREYKNVKVIECDLGNIYSAKTQLSGNIDVFFHLAWDNPSGPLRPDFLTQVKNITYTSNIVELMQTTGCRRIIVAGTVSEQLCRRIDEAVEFVPSSYYLYSKRYAHDVLRQLSFQNDINLTWCTFCHPIGEFNKPEQVIAKTIRNLLQNMPASFGSGINLFDIIAVEDLANALYLASITQLKRNRYYIGSGEPKTLRRYLERVQNIVNRSGVLQFGVLPDDNLVLEKDWLDCSEFCTETGFVPQVSFDTAVRRTADWIKSEMVLNISGGR